MSSDDEHLIDDQNRRRFMQAVDTYLAEKSGGTKSIGLLGEKTMHAVLKAYLSPRVFHEQRVGGYHADILDENGITEIQTRGFDKLRPKLKFFLKEHTVTVVHPIARIKYLVWIDPATAEMSAKRKSPKKGNIYECFDELYKIKMFLHDKNLKFRIILTDILEYKYRGDSADTRDAVKTGYINRYKNRGTRYDRVPLDIIDDVYIGSNAEFRKLIPPGLPEQFGVKEFAEAAHIRLRNAQIGLNVLMHVGVVERAGKQGRRFMYCVASVSDRI